VVVESNWTESVENFEDLNIQEPLLRGIYGYGFEKPSAIQKKGILPLLKGRDTIA
jgi:translation initiation factor 4A